MSINKIDAWNTFKDKTNEEIASIFIQGCFKNYDINNFSWYFFCNVVAETVNMYQKAKIFNEKQAKEIHNCVSKIIHKLIIGTHIKQKGDE